MFLHSLLAGVISGVSVWYTLPSTLNQLYGNSTAAVVIVFTLSWFSILIGVHPLVVGGTGGSGGSTRPVETAVYRMVDEYELVAMSRPLHLALFFAVHLAQM